MAKEAKKATKLEKKLRVLLGGYNVRDSTDIHGYLYLTITCINVGKGSGSLQAIAGHS